MTQVDCRWSHIIVQTNQFDKAGISCNSPKAIGIDYSVGTPFSISLNGIDFTEPQKYTYYGTNVNLQLTFVNVSEAFFNSSVTSDLGESLAASLGYPAGSVKILTVGSKVINPRYTTLLRRKQAPGRRRAGVPVTFQVPTLVVHYQCNTLIDIFVAFHQHQS